MELRREGGKDFTPRALRFTLENAPATLRTLTLQKQNGDWHLLLWNELENYAKDRGDIKNAPATPTLRFAPQMGALKAVALYAQGEIADDVYGAGEGAREGGFRAAAAAPEIKDGAVALSIPSRVVILQVRAQNAAPAEAPPPVAAISGTGAANSLALIITPPAAQYASV